MLRCCFVALLLCWSVCWYYVNSFVYQLVVVVIIVIVAAAAVVVVLLVVVVVVFFICHYGRYMSLLLSWLSL